MIITEAMIEAGSRVHNPFAFDGDTPLHREQSRDEARREVHAILSAALAAMPTVDATQGALALYLNEVQPVDGRVQINVSIDELTVLRHLAAATPAVGGEHEELIDGLEGLSQLLSKENTGSDVGFDDICWRSAQALRAAQPASPLRGRESIENQINDLGKDAVEMHASGRTKAGNDIGGI